MQNIEFSLEQSIGQDSGEAEELNDKVKLVSLQVVK